MKAAYEGLKIGGIIITLIAACLSVNQTLINYQLNLKQLKNQETILENQDKMWNHIHTLEEHNVKAKQM